MPDIRIFSYLPNPRIWKSTVAARLCGVDVELRGAKPGELQDWLWDFDARPLTDVDRQSTNNARTSRTGFRGRLFKTDAFLDAHPFGTVPAGFSADGSIGIFESNSIMRAVARLGEHRVPLYGTDAYSAGRIDSFLDASLVFARDSQIYLLSMRGAGPTPDVHTRAESAFTTYLDGIERALAPDKRFLCGDGLTLADICFVAELTLFSREKACHTILSKRGLKPIVPDTLSSSHALAAAHYDKLCRHEAFVPDLAPYLAKLDEDIAKDRQRIAAAS